MKSDMHAHMQLTPWAQVSYDTASYRACSRADARLHSCMHNTVYYDTMRLYVYYANACYLSILAHAAVVNVFVTACGRDVDASNISKHLLQRVNISLCDRREYRITCGTAGRVALETMRAMMSRRHHIVTAHSSMQLWPAFQSQVQDTQNKWQTPTNPLQLCK